MYDFEFVRPASLSDAIAALKDDETEALGGGQTLLPTMKQRLASPARLVSVAGLLGEDITKTADGGVTIAGGARHATVAASADVPPGLAGLAAHIGDPAVRNRGTIGGSLANNDPAACYPAAALALNATIVTNARSIAADDYFQGMFTTALDDGELVTRVDFPGGIAAANYQKFVQPASRFALVGVMVARHADGVRVAVTGASEDGVFRWSEAETALSGSFTPDAVKGMSISADGLIGDIHGTPAYRAHLVGVLTRRAVAAA